MAHAIPWHGAVDHMRRELLEHEAGCEPHCIHHEIAVNCKRAVVARPVVEEGRAAVEAEERGDNLERKVIVLVEQQHVQAAPSDEDTRK